jgi:hypothetical protein
LGLITVCEVPFLNLPTVGFLPAALGAADVALALGMGAIAAADLVALTPDFHLPRLRLTYPRVVLNLLP